MVIGQPPASDLPNRICRLILGLILSQRHPDRRPQTLAVIHRLIFWHLLDPVPVKRHPVGGGKGLGDQLGIGVVQSQGQIILKRAVSFQHLALHFKNF